MCTLLVGASRFWERAFVRAVSTLTGRSGRHRTLIVGAGRGGRSLLRELREVVGNLFGSNLFNSLIAGAIVGFVSGGTPARAGVTLLVAMILTSGLAWALLRRGLTLNRVEGLALLAAYGLTLPMLLAT